MRTWAPLKCKCGKPPIEGNRVYVGYKGPPVCSKCGSS